jgi:Na+-transporting methylmalonyl-CoA/oxaloacetate decarboxylase gamma subunit
MGSDTLQQQADTLAAWGKTGFESIAAGDGIMISIVGVLIVFASLAVISVLIRVLKHIAAGKKKAVTKDEIPARNGVSGEVVAAIATALQHHLFEWHDEERTIITIKKVSRNYSPWSSKLYGMTPSPYKHISQP